VTQRILTDLLGSLTGAERQALAAQLGATPLPVTQE
jgi:hypothetical protein